MMYGSDAAKVERSGEKEVGVRKEGLRKRDLRLLWCSFVLRRRAADKRVIVGEGRRPGSEQRVHPGKEASERASGREPPCRRPRQLTAGTLRGHLSIRSLPKSWSGAVHAAQRWCWGPSRRVLVVWISRFALPSEGEAGPSGWAGESAKTKHGCRDGWKQGWKEEGKEGRRERDLFHLKAAVVLLGSLSLVSSSFKVKDVWLRRITSALKGVAPLAVRA
eukprot:866181-Rhodomonas_salina.2